MTNTSWLHTAQERCAAATQLPWASRGVYIFSPKAKAMVCELSEPYHSRFIEHVPLELGSKDAPQAYANGDFIAHARIDLPLALELLRQAAEALKELELMHKTFVRNEQRCQRCGHGTSPGNHGDNCPFAVLDRIRKGDSE